MVKRSKKSKSKRVSLKQKYKVIRKVKEHHKKKAKEAKKSGLKHKRMVEKDPGIPNDWPFKEQELKALEARRARALEELEQKKAARKERAKKRKMGLLEDDEKELSIEEVKGIDVSTGIVNARDNSDRAFYKELVKVIEASDVILEVLDARDPLGTRCVDMETMVMKSGPDKHLVLLLNKIDLVPRESVEKWLKYLREELPAVAFKCSTQDQRSNLGWKSSKAMKPSNLLQTSDCLGAETLIKLLKNYSRSHEIKKSITVGVIGLPNVGKSSLINSLKRCHVVNVGATPGLTRSMQEVQLDKNVKLLDCPGVVMLKSSGNDASIALRNCKRIEKLDDPVAPATVRGKLKKGGIVDVEAAARIILHDWNEGKIPYYTMPPGRNQEEPSEARIVTELGKEFNVDEVYSTESSFIGSLKSADDFHSVQVPPSHPLNFDETILEDNARPLPSTEVDESQEIISDEPMASEEHDAEKAKSKYTTGKQNEKLYAVEGMFNPKTKRAENKRNKKVKNKSTLGGDAMDDEDDYDFGVDYVKGKGQNTGGVPMSGIEVDE
ncbi:Guanine nucleotide-binding protein-like 3 [Gossypium arboreum]|uniref:Guanine nucleotide-binding protein-like 3 n=1 Tax=Gossypium arboreum TaxID=29729 RepID=A0A0B0NWG2_GOSAR|nr:Guanine nucleotide-binding protein-like 3 [Gossypium arboreum]KHG18793.1 Guanine nucleotide-binding protein-like 3 [Gossypium arboreum]